MRFYIFIVQVVFGFLGKLAQNDGKFFQVRSVLQRNSFQFNDRFCEIYKIETHLIANFA